MEKFDLKKGKMIRHPYDKSEVSLKKKLTSTQDSYIYYIFMFSEKRETLKKRSLKI